MKLNKTIPQGSRIILRDAEWLVKSVDQTSSKGQKLSVIGLSEIVQDKEMLFLTEYEKPIRVLDPADTKLILDNSPRYIKSRLYMESLIRQTPPQSKAISIGDQCAADTWPFQLEPAALALSSPRQRILIADGVGLGKTIEAGILLSELIRRGRGKRILVVTAKCMLSQFQKEIWSRFTIPLTRLDSVGLQRVQSKIPGNQNPFHYYDKTIISIDTLKQNNTFRDHLEKAYWDIIVVDEAHNVAERGTTKSDRHKLAILLSKRSDTLIMLTATPHDGNQKSFASLIQMLDPRAIANEEDIRKEKLEGLFIRRLKKDLPGSMFKEKKTISLAAKATESEERFFQALATTSFETLNKHRSENYLFSTLLEKMIFSSPVACKELIQNKIKKLQNNSKSNIHDLAALEHLLTLVKEITPKEFSKYQKLLEELKNPQSLNFWTGKDPKDRLVIFTESRATLKFLHENLAKDLNLKDEQVKIMHGSLSDLEQQEIVEDFGNEKSVTRLLLTTDVASEGINLHYLCHRLVHFDLPWSIMVYQQRSGRIDRYGQEQEPILTYLITNTEQQKIAGDLAILDKLRVKDEQIHANIGDPLTIQTVYQEENTLKAIEEDSLFPDEQIKSGLLKEEEDFFDFLSDMMNSASSSSTEPVIERIPSLFEDDFHFLKEGLELLYTGKEPCFEFCESQKSVTFSPIPEELAFRFQFFPPEIISQNKKLTLTSDKNKVCSSSDRGKWPESHYLWHLHPILAWVRDRIYAQFGRLEAPIIHLPGLVGEDEAVFILSGLLPNKKGHPLIQRLFCVSFIKGRPSPMIRQLNDFLQTIELKKKEYPNTNHHVALHTLQKLLPEAIRLGQEWMQEERKAFYQINTPLLEKQLKDLEERFERCLKSVEHKFDASNGIKAFQEKKRREELARVKEDFEEQKQWIKETMETDHDPHFQVLGVICGGKEASGFHRNRES